MATAVCCKKAKYPVNGDKKQKNTKVNRGNSKFIRYVKGDTGDTKFQGRVLLKGSISCQTCFC